MIANVVRDPRTLKSNEHYIAAMLRQRSIKYWPDIRHPDRMHRNMN